MMHRVWLKIFVAGLIILGEDAFASESNQRIDSECEASGNAVQLTQPIALDVTGSRWQSPLAGTNTIWSDFKLTYQTFVVVVIPVSNLLKYHPFNPRAPPVPAS